MMIMKRHRATFLIRRDAFQLSQTPPLIAVFGRSNIGFKHVILLEAVIGFGLLRHHENHGGISNAKHRLRR